MNRAVFLLICVTTLQAAPAAAAISTSTGNGSISMPAPTTYMPVPKKAAVAREM